MNSFIVLNYESRQNNFYLNFVCVKILHIFIITNKCTSNEKMRFLAVVLGLKRNFVNVQFCVLDVKHGWECNTQVANICRICDITKYLELK